MIFFKSIGSFVVVDESGKEQAIESGSKVTCIVSQVLFYEQVRALQKSPEWYAFSVSLWICNVLIPLFHQLP